ncbi:MAG: T9SS type A sorting domain-containing protein [Bacteroidales bacterium]|nr:T9SS type A sorting domain-containing protein [Bacteroidales bacterium]MCF8387159.1 T9SS type A sorting domain-containing protein [Bacteroidales bacterium]MCF8397626.1 T9SS type A sorting domain-containing protein [Bacteroidales bacterium]
MKKITFTVIISFTCYFASAQTGTPQIVSTAGNTVHHSEISLQWTLGEFFIEHYQNENLNLTQGFQQPQNMLVTAIESDKPVQYLIYPNPTKNEFFIEFGDEEGSFIIELYDSRGTKLYSEELNGSHLRERIETIGFQSNVFLLKITNADSQKTNCNKIVKQR